MEFRSLRSAFLFAAPAFIMLASPALASQFQDKVAGWEIVQSDSSCGMFMAYEGPGQTTLLFVKNSEGKLAISIGNNGWSAVPDAKYDISFALNGAFYGGSQALGRSNDGQKGFLAHLERSFESDLAKGHTLHIFLNEKEIDRLSLRGTSAALVQLNRCVSSLKARITEAETEKRRWEDFPADPFAKPAELNRPVTPRGNPASWATTNDYPPRALREEREGRVHFKVTVGTDGRVTSCEITTSSGSPDLDEATCTNVRRRARFTPATDGNGSLIEGEFSSSVNWFIPRG